MSDAPSSGDTDRLSRDTALVTALTAISRVTGFARIVVSAAVLGTGLLGDVYQSANTVPNIVFELLAGGALQAALVPLFVGVRRQGGDDRFARTVGLVGSTVAAALSAIALGLMLTSPIIARLLTSAEPVASIATDKAQLASWMLVVFAPQIVFYGLGLVSSAALQARRRFAAAAIAPAVNNLVVIATYLLFDAMRDADSPALELTAMEIAVLAGGTTLAVVAFTSVPVVALIRATDHPLHPRVSFADPVIRSVARTGGWAVIQVGGTLALTAGALVVGNGAAGGVAVFALALAVFLLPYALLVGPVATATMPRLAHHHQDGDEPAFAALVRRSSLRVVVPSAVAALGLGLLAWPIARVVVFGAAEERGPGPVAHALIAFSIGVVPYGVHQLLSRVLMSRGEVRTAASVSVITAIAGIALMVVLSAAMVDEERAAALALAYSLAHLVGLVVLVPLTRASMRTHVRRPVSGHDDDDDDGGDDGDDGGDDHGAQRVAIELIGPSTGGIRRHVVALTSDLRSAGWTVVVAGPIGVIADARDVSVPTGVSWGAIRRARRQLVALVDELRPAVVHAHGLKAGWVAIGVTGPRCVLTVHNVVLERGIRGAVLRLLERRVVTAADAVIATSEEIQKRFAAVRNDIVVVRPVHDVESVRTTSQQVRESLHIDGALIVTVARLHKQKDIDTLIRAIASVRSVEGSVSLVVVGDGPEREHLESLARDLVPPGAVTFLGERNDAVDIMAAADVVVISSTWESGPLTLLEAGAVGAAVVSTPVGFVPELIRDGVEGRLVPIGDDVRLAEAIMSLVGQPDLAASMAAALHAAVVPRLDRAEPLASIIALYGQNAADRTTSAMRSPG